MQTTSTRSHLYALAATTAILSFPAAQAASYQWRPENANNNWSTALGDTNWFIDGDTTFSPWTDGNDAVFNGATGETVTLIGSLVPSSITVSGDATWNLTGGGSIAGSGTLTKSGAGTLTLSNTTANSYSGGTFIQGGTLSIGTGGTGANTATTSALGSGNVSIDSGATLRLWIQNSTDFTITNPFTLNGGTILNEDGRHTLTGSVSLGANGATLRSKWAGKNLTLSGVISGTGALTTARFDAGGHADSTIILTGSNSFSGGTTVQSARLQLGNAPAADQGGVGILRGTLTVNSPGLLLLNTTNALGYFNNNKVDTLNINGATVSHAANGDNGWGVAYRFTGGTLETTGTGRYAFGGGTSVTTFAHPSPANINGLVYLRNDNSVTFTTADGDAFHDLQINATLNQITSNSGLVKEGPGTLYLNGTTNHTGTTSVNAGTLILGTSGTLPNSPVSVGANATFRNEAVGKSLTSLTALANATLALPATSGGTTTVTNTATLPASGILNIAPIPSASLTPGSTVTLLSAGNLTGNPTLQQADAFGPTRASGTLSQVGNEIRYTAVTAGGNLIWTNQSASGAATGTWDLDTTANFDFEGSPSTFLAFDQVSFDDSVATGSAKTVNLSGNLAPARIVVSNSSGNNYTLNAATSGAGNLIGQADINKSGAGSLILGANLLVNSSGAHFDLSGGTLDLGGKTLPRQAKLTLSGNATLANGNLPLQEAELLEGTISGVVQNSPTWTKTDTGTVILTSNSTFGAGTVEAGNLQVGNGGNSGSLGSAAIAIGPDGTLTFRRSDNGYTVANSISGTGQLVFNGTNDGVANLQSHYPVTGNNSNFSGSILITNSRLQADNPNDVGTAVITTGTNGQWYVSAGTYTNDVNIAGLGWGETNGPFGALRVSGGSVLNGTVNLTGNARISAHGSNATINGAIVETGGSRNLELGGTNALSTLVLGGDSTYTGTTTIQNANVTLHGSLSSSLVTVNAGSTLQGGGDINGSLTFGTGATSWGVNAARPERLMVLGTLTLSGVTTVNVLTGEELSPGGSITLATATQIDGLPANLALANPTQFRQAVFTVNPNSITLDIGSKSITWTGTANGNWDAGATANFSDPAATAFYQGDVVNFDDTSSVGTVSLVGALNPAQIAVNNTNTNYTFNGTGSISGGANLVKSGTGSLTIQAAMLYTGPTHVQGGTLIFDGSQNFNRQADHQTITIDSGAAVEIRGVNALPNAAVAVSVIANEGSTLRVVSGASPSTSASTASHSHLRNLTLRGATVELPYSGTSTAYNNESFQLNGTLTVEGTTPSLITSGELATLQGIALAGARTFHIDDVTGSSAADLVVQAEIENNDGNNGALVKTGDGTLALMQANTYSAGTTVSAGTLMLGNGTNGSATGTGAVSIAAGASLTGNGTSTGAVSIAGTLSPGEDQTGTLHTGNATLTGVYHCELTGSLSDRLSVTGNLTLDGAVLDLQPSSIGEQAYIIASYTGTLTGTFASENNLPPGYSVVYAYHDGTSSGNIAIVPDSLGTPYDNWANANGVGGDTPETDSDGDGIANAIEFVIGGDPSGPDSSSRHLLPTAEATATELVFVFRRTAESASVLAVVEWGTTLSSWNTAVHGQDGITIDEEPNGFDAGINRVTVRIPRTLANPGSRLFARLKVEIN